MLLGAGCRAQGPDPACPRTEDLGSLSELRAEGPGNNETREDLRGQKLSPSPAQSTESMASHPYWLAEPGLEEVRTSPSLPSTPDTLSIDSRPATGPLACLDRRREARLPFSKFLDEVTVRVLDPETLESFWGPRGRSPDSSVGTAAEATVEPGPGVESRGPPVDSDERGHQATSPWRSPGRSGRAGLRKPGRAPRRRAGRAGVNPGQGGPPGRNPPLGTAGSPAVGRAPGPGTPGPSFRMPPPSPCECPAKALSPRLEHSQSRSFCAAARAGLREGARAGGSGEPRSPGHRGAAAPLLRPWGPARCAPGRAAPRPGGCNSAAAEWAARRVTCYSAAGGSPRLRARDGGAGRRPTAEPPGCARGGVPPARAALPDPPVCFPAGLCRRHGETQSRGVWGRLSSPTLNTVSGLRGGSLCLSFHSFLSSEARRGTLEEDPRVQGWYQVDSEGLGAHSGCLGSGLSCAPAPWPPASSAGSSVMFTCPLAYSCLLFTGAVPLSDHSQGPGSPRRLLARLLRCTRNRSVGEHAYPSALPSAPRDRDMLLFTGSFRIELLQGPQRIVTGRPEVQDGVSAHPSGLTWVLESQCGPCVAASPRRRVASAGGVHRLRSPWVPSCLGQSQVLQGRLARSSPSIWDSALQEQKGELRKRLSYTTHKLEKLETEFDSTRHYLEIELRRAQEELEKVTEKLRRIQSNYLALQRINQELEDKLYRMGQHYEEEKRALSHEIVALNSHLLEAKVTIDKLSEDNELYRKDCNLAAQLLQCSQTYGRAHKVSELPSDFQERVNLHMEQHACSLPSPLCHPAYADSVPACVIAKVLEKPDPSSLSSRLSDASARDLPFRDGLEKPRPPYKGDIYCSDTALYCPDERRRDRRPSVDPPGTEGFLRAQNSTDSALDEEEEEAEAAGYPAAYRHGFPGYAGSLPTSSSYSSFSATSEEKEHAQASTLTASQQAIYLNSRDELFERKAPSYQGSPRFATATATATAGPLEAEVAPGFARTVSPYPAEPFRFPASPGPRQALMPPKMWSLQAKPASARLSGEEPRSQWRPLSVEDIGPYSYPTSRASPCSFSERYYGSVGSVSSPGKKAEGRASPLYASYKGDSFSEGDDLSQGRLAESCFLRAGADLSLSPGRSADPMPGYAASEGSGERLGVQLCGPGGSPESERGPGYGSEHSPSSSRGSLEPSSMEASPEMRPAALLSTQQAFPRTGSSGLSRKDSLTKAQLYGTLLN
ncbi:PREDICTED: uncharacterized protein LOC102858933 [Elephantulus edwardii]|uniref:uncharacterized protein LOC102858933 n=1 Tax=Elephantulus edwardii TaxID=28737 RepID=UPI0003F0C3C8|nr:PREDICTED: uncharacterized protein LOC102858933 [Elephantulus edwardii]